MPDRIEDLARAVANFGEVAKRKLSSPVATGQPEDQLRSPVEAFFADLAPAVGRDPGKLVMVGESHLADLMTRPDFAVTYSSALVGFVELKAPGKGADPRRFRDAHDRAQWERLKALPNLIYTDGNAFSLWRNGKLEGAIVQFDGDITASGRNLRAPEQLLVLFESFIDWTPLPPRSVRELADTTARLCRLLRDEVSEQIELGAAALSGLAAEWRHLLFPEATNAQLADGYAQAITFGLLLARARQITLTDLDEVGKHLGARHSLIGGALRVLAQSTTEGVLKTSIDTLMRVLGVVDWQRISKGESNAWLYFYEDFLAEYDNTLRKQTGSYYTPPEVVHTMTRLVDEALISRFDLSLGLAESNVRLLEPAFGTGTFILAVLQRIAATIDADQGEGARPAALVDALERIFGFEIQLGPYSVAQLRVLAELVELGAGTPPQDALKLYVTNTLDDPFVEDQGLGLFYEPIARSRREANKVKKSEPVMVVIGNPPYKERSRGKGGWIEHGNPEQQAPLDDFLPPSDWGVGLHVHKLYNPYVYFWRFGTWKVFDQNPADGRGIVCFITVAGFLAGPGFQKMRDYLRRRADEIFVIDCSPEGHQPPVSTRIFQAVQQSVCITLAIRDATTSTDTPARVHYRQLARGERNEKFAELATLDLDRPGWRSCGSEWRAPFLPASEMTWLACPDLEDLLCHGISGVTPHRTWIVAPDKETLRQRWHHLVTAPAAQKPELMLESSDRYVNLAPSATLYGIEVRQASIGNDSGACPEPIRMAYRPLDRQWIIPDIRLMDRPRPTLWAARGDRQIYLAAPSRLSADSGPGICFASLIPDFDFHRDYHANASGRVYPLFLDAAATMANTTPELTAYLQSVYNRPVTPEDVFAYIAAIAATPIYTRRFAKELEAPGIRIPLTADPMLFAEALEIGKRIIWLQTYGERFIDQTESRPHRSPRLTPPGPRVSGAYPIPSEPSAMPDEMNYDVETEQLRVGAGVITNVTQAMWNYEVGGRNVLGHWFSYRSQNREHPSSGNRSTSPLSAEYVHQWSASYTEELIDLLHVLGLLVEIEPQAEELLERIMAAPLVSVSDLESAKVLPVSAAARQAPAVPRQASLLT